MLRARRLFPTVDLFDDGAGGSCSDERLGGDVVVFAILVDRALEVDDRVALNAASGEIIAKCYQRHRAVEFKKFLNETEKAMPTDLDIRIVMDNYATHKTPAIQNWFAKRLCWQVHFNAHRALHGSIVERFIADLTDKQIKRGAHKSVDQLEQAIMSYVDGQNQQPKPFGWVKTADQIFDAGKRFCQRVCPDDCQTNF